VHLSFGLTTLLHFRLFRVLDFRLKSHLAGVYKSPLFVLGFLAFLPFLVAFVAFECSLLAFLSPLLMPFLSFAYTLRYTVSYKTVSNQCKEQ